MPAPAALVDKAIADAGPDVSVGTVMDHLFVTFCREILQIVPGRVSSEVDACLSFDISGTIKKANEIIALYEKAGISRDRVPVKTASA